MIMKKILIFYGQYIHYQNRCTEERMQGQKDVKVGNSDLDVANQTNLNENASMCRVVYRR